MRIYNTLSRSIEEFKPLKEGFVGMYTCGPTVYDYQHIGHMRRYVGDDIVVRTLKASGYAVKQVMNITDVGHLVSDSDEGEDKMEKGAKKFGMSVWDIAKKFEKQFFDSSDALGIQRPTVIMHATEYIKEQIALITTLEKRGYTYRIDDGIYFDTSKFPDYFKLSRQNPEQLKKGARVAFMSGKRNLSDFALWKFSPTEKKRHMQWNSPWGVGFPGWHIECSAMSMKELGETFDIHTGGIDHIAIHHTNEIAQSQAATGEKFVHYWLHHNFLMVEGEKMSKSLGNIYTVQDLVDRGFDPLALRYLFLQTHYRQEMNFTWESLEASQKALERLRLEVYSWQAGEIDCAEYEREFLEALKDDFNTAKALAVLWELVHSSLPEKAKYAGAMYMDNILGLDIFRTEVLVIPDLVKQLLKEREKVRQEGNYDASDKLRTKIHELGFTVQDSKDGQKISKV